MIEPSQPAANPAPTTAARDAARPELTLQSALHTPFRTTLASHFQSPIAQHLLGEPEEDARIRHKQPGAPTSITELSGRAIADLGAPAATPHPAQTPPPPPEPRTRPAAQSDRQQHQPQNSAAQHPEANTQQPRSEQTPADSARNPAQPNPQLAATPLQPQPPSNKQPAQPRTPPAPAIPSAATPQNASFREQGASNNGVRNDNTAAARALNTTQRHFRLESSPTTTRPQQTPAQPEDDQRFAAQLSRGLAAILRQGGGSLTMRLNPQALGDLTIKMNLAPGNVAATFTASTTQARDLLQDSLTHLRAALEARGLAVERLDVHLADAAEPPRHTPDDGSKGQHDDNTGGAGTQGRDAHGRRDAPESTARGGAAGSAQSPERDTEGDQRLQDAPARDHAALRLWQHSEGGAHTIRLHLDAVA